MQRKLEINDRDFFKKPFSLTEIENLLQGRPASEMFNFRSPSFQKLGMDREKLKHKDLVELMLKETRLIRRPVVQIGKRVYFGATSKLLEVVIK